MNADAVEEFKSSTPLRQLLPMLVGDLQVECRHKGRVLYGELSVEPSKLEAVHTMVVDETGQDVNLWVYNVAPRRHSPQEIQVLFPKGLKVAVKEPYFKVATDGSHIIRVDNPADIIRNPKSRKGFSSRNNSSSSPPSSLSSFSSSSPSSSSQPPVSQFKVHIHADELRKRGNEAFVDQDWKQAVQLYTETAQLLLQSRGISSSTILSEVSKDLALVFSNRAEARLRLKHFEAAEVDAGKALKLHPHHVKSLCRKGKALHGLHRYKEALLCFEEALNVSDEKAIEALKVSSEVCNKQARTGEYDLVGLWREVERGEEPVCGEFIGPVEIGPASERALGRGLLVTRDVEPGELLLVSKAVAHGKGINVFQQVMDRAISSARFREQVYCLAMSSTTGVNGIESHIPVMDLFLAKPASTRCDDVSLNLEDIDVDRLSGVIRTNAFIAAYDSDDRLWLLPSFINHSCTPNSCWMQVGNEALFVRAAHHLTKGQEITISYYLETGGRPYAHRAALFKSQRGFDCRCDRCSLENSLEPFTKPLTALSRVDSLEAAMVVESLEWAFQNTRAFENEKQKQWLRSSYALCYVTVLRNASLQQRMSKFEPLESVMKAVLETMGGTEDFLALIRQEIEDEECSSRVKASYASMCLCVYGRQPLGTLDVLLELRRSMIQKDFTIMHHPTWEWE